MLPIRNRQYGITVLGLLFVSIILVCLLLLGFRLAPAYIEHFKVKSTMKSVKEEFETTAVRTGTNARVQIKRSIMRRFVVEDVRRVRPKSIHVKSSTDGTEIQIAYNVEVRLFSNVFVLIKFDDTELIPRYAKTS